MVILDMLYLVSAGDKELTMTYIWSEWHLKVEKR